MRAPTSPTFLRYMDTDGKAEPISPTDDPDNPSSVNFVPLTVRTERDKARWWALHAGKAGQRQTHGEFD